MLRHVELSDSFKPLCSCIPGVVGTTMDPSSPSLKTAPLLHLLGCYKQCLNEGASIFSAEVLQVRNEVANSQDMHIFNVPGN